MTASIRIPLHATHIAADPPGRELAETAAICGRDRNKKVVFMHKGRLEKPILLVSDVAAIEATDRAISFITEKS